jgi:hypothetical protein
MDPTILTADQWARINDSLRFLVLFVGLVINTTMSFLLAHAIIPSLVTAGEAPAATSNLRRILYPISAVSAVLVIWAFSTALAGIIPVIQQYYPRFPI